MLVGRDGELGRIDEAISLARRGESSTLVLVGDPGIGKSSLLAASRAAAESAGLEVLTAHGVEAEHDLAFGGLTELLGAVVSRRDQIPTVQAKAVATALALEDGPPPDPFAVAASVLSLLANLAESAKGVLVSIDDAQWLDPPSLTSILFTARRMGPEGIAFLIASRPIPSPELHGDWLQKVELGGLAGEAAERVFDEAAEVAPGPLGP